MTEDTQIGTLSVPLSLNRYIYALDNPMRYVDPTGHYDVQSNGGGGSMSPEGFEPSGNKHQETSINLLLSSNCQAGFRTIE